jgi:hypothetical protein
MKVLNKILISVLLASIATAVTVFQYPDAELVQYVMPSMKFGFGAVLILSAISVYTEDELNDFQKNLVMNGFLIAILLPTLWAVGAFIHESETSWSNGEVHWHADFEVLVQENGELQRKNLVDPGQFCETTTHESSYMCKISDRTGSTEYHEHNDQRIHLEGTFKTREDATLSAFFETFGGELTNTRMVYPTNDELINVSNSGDKTLKIIVKKGVVNQREWCVVGSDAQLDEICESHGERADSPQNYVVSPHTQGPTLDDIYFIYDNASTQEALENLRENDEYKGFGLLKSGEGYGG